MTATNTLAYYGTAVKSFIWQIVLPSFLQNRTQQWQWLLLPWPGCLGQGEMALMEGHIFEMVSSSLYLEISNNGF
jgi:hypothetical protein